MRPYQRRVAAWTALAALTFLPVYGQAETAAPSTTTPSPADVRNAATQQASAHAAGERQERRIAALHRQLKITPAQQPQWDAFTAVMHDNLAHMHEVYGQNIARGASTALDDMRGYAAITTAHAQDVQKLVPAFDALYAAMSPEQQKTADAVFHQYARQQARATPARE